LIGSYWYFRSTSSKTNLADLALISLVKNDIKSFEKYIARGGDLNAPLPAINGKVLTVSEGIAQFERPGFVEYLQTEKKKFVQQGKSSDDIISIAVTKNNPELFTLLMKEQPDLNKTYTNKDWTLLHLASAQCSTKIVDMLHQTKALSWDQKAKDGSTPLTLAAENNCLPALSYFKEKGAKFDLKDGRGISALDILKKSKDAALSAFAQTFEMAAKVPGSLDVARAPASFGKITKELNIYRKRVFPNQGASSRSHVEPDSRPDGSLDSADVTEFSD
jgi:hypothetical protein